MPQARSSISGEVKTLSTALSQRSHCSRTAGTWGSHETLGLAAGSMAEVWWWRGVRSGDKSTVVGSCVKVRVLVPCLIFRAAMPVPGRTPLTLALPWTQLLGMSCLTAMGFCVHLVSWLVLATTTLPALLSLLRPASEDAAPASTVQPRLLLPWSCRALLRPRGWPNIICPLQNVCFPVALKHSPLRLGKTTISKVWIFCYCKYQILCSSTFSAREGRAGVSALKQNLLCIHRRNVLYTYWSSFFIQKRLRARNFLFRVFIARKFFMNTKQINM